MVSQAFIIGLARILRRPLIAVAILFAGAMLIRVVNLQTIDTNPCFRAPIMDEQHHHAWATQIVLGQGGDYLPFHRAPCYPYVLAGLCRMTPDR